MITSENDTITATAFCDEADCINHAHGKPWGSWDDFRRALSLLDWSFDANGDRCPPCNAKFSAPVGSDGLPPSSGLPPETKG